ncbi:MAG TPA: aminoacyl-tRNA hydrolase [Terriglobales bacterium]
MKLIVGLGNPGIEYQFTPHNLGFLAIDRLGDDFGVDVNNRQCRALTARFEVGSETVLLAKPETFMNLSGLSVNELVKKNDLEPDADLVVIQDELDFAFGTVRVQKNRSSAGHNGIESIIGALGTQDFLRIRLGVAHAVSDGVSYLLSPMGKAQLKIVDKMLDTTAEAVKVILAEGSAAAMNRFNRKPDEVKE